MNVKETLRYLGYHGQEADSQVLALVEQCWKELEGAASPKSIYGEYPLGFFEEDGIDVYGFKTRSRALKKNLDGCVGVVMFAATLGTGVDMLLKRYGKLQMSKAVVIQAAAAAMLEDYCDEINEEIQMVYEKKMRFLRPRFSPGYGDFPIECQRDLIRVLDCARSIGLTLTEGCMMAPSKSVTAVIGAGRTVIRCHRQGCESCEKIDCIYRRDTL